MKYKEQLGGSIGILEVIRLNDRVWQFHEKNEFSPVDAYLVCRDDKADDYPQ